MKGYNCYFYDVNYNLKPNIESINRFLGMKIGIFLHMGYFGFPTNNNLYNCINQFKKQGTIIVEDVTHTLFSIYERYIQNDYYIASLRKWTSLPSGGFLASKSNNIQEQLDIHIDFSNIRKEALLLKGEYIKSNNQKLKQKFLLMFNDAESILDNDFTPYSIDCISNTIINKLDVDELINKRRENYVFLLENLNNIEEIDIIFNRISDGVCPLFFPVYIKKDRDKIKKNLIKENLLSCTLAYIKTDKYYKLSIK